MRPTAPSWAVVAFLVWAPLLAGALPLAAQPAAGTHAHQAPTGAGVGALTLTTLRTAGFVDVTLDARRFRQEQIATIRIVNLLEIPVSGDIPGCQTVFEPDDARLAALAPAESGPFVVGPSQTIQLTRPFRALDPSKRAPEGSAYSLSATPFSHDLSRCPED